MKIKNLKIEDLKNLGWYELIDIIYDDLIDLSIDQVTTIKRKVFKKIEGGGVKESDKKIYNDVNRILYGNLRNKVYNQNKEWNDAHTNHMLYQLPKDLTASKIFHKEQEKKQRLKNPELAAYHMRMFRSLTEQGY